MAAVSRATTMEGMVTRWGPPGPWVMVGEPTWLNYGLSGVGQLGYAMNDFAAVTVEQGTLRYPIAEEGWVWGTIKGLIGQRVIY